MARSPTFGRRKPLLFNLGIYVLATFVAAFAPNCETLLALRFVQGISAATTRVIALSVVRECFGRRKMAEIMSLIFIVFMIVPVVTHAMGKIVILFLE